MDDFDGTYADDREEIGQHEEIGRDIDGVPYEIAGEAQDAAIMKVIETVRDNRHPAPPMKALPIDAPPTEDVLTDWLADVTIGAAVATGQDQFPLTTAFLARAGAGMDAPRYVRVDTEESYQEYRKSSSPELQALHDKVDTIHEKLNAHIADPTAHHPDDNVAEVDAFDDGVADDVAEAEILGAEADAAEDQKKLDVWMESEWEGKYKTWRDGNDACASLSFPGSDGAMRICTSIEPIDKGIDEMSRAAVMAKVPASAVVGCLPAMGANLSAATAMKDMLAAAPAILARPEAQKSAPFVCRIEPKTNPGIFALALLMGECRKGNAAACDEWSRLAAAAKVSGALAVGQAMLEAMELCKAKEAIVGKKWWQFWR